MAKGFHFTLMQNCSITENLCAHMHDTYTSTLPCTMAIHACVCVPIALTQLMKQYRERAFPLVNTTHFKLNLLKSK